MVTAIIAIAFLSQLSTLVNIIGDTFGTAANNYPIKLSIFHSLFNLLGVIIMIPFVKPLIKLLTKIFVEEPKGDDTFEYPVFLNEAVLAYPQTAIKALLDESKRLFEKTTYEIVSHGLNLHRSDIEGDSKLKKVVKESQVEMKLNIEEMYYRKIKIIYSKIVEYATLAQSQLALSSSGMEAFTRIKLANRNMVETVKNIRGLRKNVNLYMTSDNEFIRKEYDKLRVKVAKVLREIYMVRVGETKEAHISRLEKLKYKAQKSDVLVNGTLDKLIRGNKITSEMATSLANDSANVAGIVKKLIETAELLYVDSDTLIQAAEENGTENN
jgi:phosphate:Na+ symporter